MATFDDERDDAALEEEAPRPAPRNSNQPLVMAALGLVLMLGGYAASTYTPAPAQGEQQRRLQELRSLADQRQAEGVNDELVDRLDQTASRQHPPSYQLAGRLAIYGGLFLFVMAGVLMYRSSPAPRQDSDEDQP